MTSVGALLKGTAPAGVYQVVGLDADPIVDEAMERGWFCAVVDGARAPTKLLALQEIGRVLDFPSHYGANLDALADCLAELKRKTLIIWVGGLSGLEDLIPVLEGRVDEEPAFAVLISVAA